MMQVGRVVLGPSTTATSRLPENVKFVIADQPKSEHPSVVMRTANCDHCYCAAAPRQKHHKRCCKCSDTRHEHFVDEGGRARGA